MTTPRARARAFVAESRRGFEVFGDRRSRVRWTADLALAKAMKVLPVPGRGAPRKVTVDGGAVLWYRLNRGDIQGVREVWLDETYRLPVEVREPTVILDLGANVGLTSVYLGRAFPGATVVAVEPSPDNAELVRRNLRENAVEGEVIEAAVAATDGYVSFATSDESNMGRIGDGDLRVRSLSMQTLLDRVAPGRDVDIVKMDIEGGEQEVFDGDLAWLQRVGVLIAEFHPEVVDYERIIATIESQGFRFIRGGSVEPRCSDTFVRNGR